MGQGGVSERRRPLDAADVAEIFRQLRANPYVSNQDLIDLEGLALDGFRFRVWIKGACTVPGLVARTLAHAIRPHDYRVGIDQLIVAGVQPATDFSERPRFGDRQPPKGAT